ncbi:MAG: universal stress protein [Muribaculaceae bacterium]|nr:universal stress protein [Muribaculaceae bacterium]
MTPNRLITIAIHTVEKALPLKNLLEREGIYVELNNVNLASPTVAAGVRIRIKESDLPLALRIIENIEIFNIPATGEEGEAGGVVLLPTDFSPHSDNAAKVAFRLASKLGFSIEMLHSFIPPASPRGVQLMDSYDYELADMAERQTIEEEAKLMMENYTARVRSWIKSGEVPAVKFSTMVTEGIPEESILCYARDKKPQLIVMGTRGADKKEAELIGSVTAEVLDSCRIPAFTVPESVDASELAGLRRVAFLCNLDQEDMIALDTLYRLFPDLSLDVMLIYIPGRRDRGDSDSKRGQAQLNLLSYCREHFPRYGFDMRTVRLDTLIDDFKGIIQEGPYNLICVPNKKRNVFARVFNPSIAHKILFRADVPMMVIPV